MLDIMCIGDSITYGLGGATGASGYRSKLFTLITNYLGYTPLGVGWDDLGASGDVRRWCGASGERTDDTLLRTVVQAPAFKPRIVFLLIGANDTNQWGGSGGPNTPTMTLDNVETILNQFRAANPNCIVFVGKITDIQNRESFVVSYNALLTTRIQARSDYVAGNVVLVDIYTAVGLYSTTTYSDGIHPSAAGYSLMADAWYAAFRTKF